MEALLRHERAIIAGGLGIVCLLAWIHLLTGAGTGMDVTAMSGWPLGPPAATASSEAAGDFGYWLIMLGMWWAMMIAMMVPSAAPTILLHAQVHRHARTEEAVAQGAIFAGGYLVAWSAFGLAATLAQWLLTRAGLVDAMLMGSTSAVLSGGLLLAAGLYQLSPLKAVCLDHCRAPAAFLSRSWRRGRLGALRMGMRHGLFCIGCCGGLMALLFVGGIMNLIWIVGLAAVVLVEKLGPWGGWSARLSGIVMTAAGGALLVGDVL